MITDLDCIQAIDELYNNKTGFDHIFDGSDTDGVYIGIKKFDTATMIVFRGSTTFEDWARDFFAVPHEPIDHPMLGMLHSGFSLGMDRAFEVLKPYLEGDIIVTGHSLGGARALIFAALMQVSPSTWTVPDVVVFGSPKPGYQKIVDILKDVVIRCYKNMDDLITHVPFKLLLLPFEYTREPLLKLNEPPAQNDPWHALGAHHHELYLQGLLKLKVAQGVPIIVQ